MRTGTRLITVAAALALSLCGTASAQAPLEAAQALEHDFRSTLGEENIPGGAFAVVADGEVAWIGTFGLTAAGRGLPVDEHTVFRLASVSKGFAATLASLMVHEGRFGWRDPVTRYRPDFRINGAVHAINIEDLLGHSTGIVSHAYDHLLEEGQPVDAIIPRFAELSSVCQPGTCYTYQNVAFSLIEPVLESAGRTRYEQLVKEMIFHPLGMDNASVGYEAWQTTANRAEPHVKRMNRWNTVEVNPNYYRVNSAAGVNASVSDMAQWLIAQLGHRPEVLNSEVIDQVTRPRIRTKRSLNNRYWRDYLTDAHYGLGWRIYHFGDEELVYHGGWVSGFRAEAAFSRRHDVGLVILMNAESNLIGELSTAFWSRMFSSPMLVDVERKENAGQPAASSGGP